MVPSSAFFSAIGPYVRTFFNVPRRLVDSLSPNQRQLNRLEILKRLKAVYDERGASDISLMAQLLEPVAEQDLTPQRFFDSLNAIVGLHPAFRPHVCEVRPYARAELRDDPEALTSYLGKLYQACSKTEGNADWPGTQPLADYLGLPVDTVKQQVQLLKEIAMPALISKVLSKNPLYENLPIVIKAVATKTLEEMRRSLNLIRTCYNDPLFLAELADSYDTDVSRWAFVEESPEEMERRIEASREENTGLLHQSEPFSILRYSADEIQTYKRSLSTAITPKNPQGFFAGFGFPLNFDEAPRSEEFYFRKREIVRRFGMKANAALSAIGPYIPVFFDLRPNLHLSLSRLSEYNQDAALVILVGFCREGHVNDIPLVAQQLKTVLEEEPSPRTFFTFLALFTGRNRSKPAFFNNIEQPDYL